MVCIFKTVLFLNKLICNNLTQINQGTLFPLVSGVEYGSYSVSLRGQGSFEFGIPESDILLSGNLSAYTSTYKIDWVSGYSAMYSNGEKVNQVETPEASGDTFFLSVLQGEAFLSNIVFYYNITYQTDPTEPITDPTEDVFVATGNRTGSGNPNNGTRSGNSGNSSRSSAWFETYSPSILTSGLLVVLVAVLFFVIPKKGTPDQPITLEEIPRNQPPLPQIPQQIPDDQYPRNQPSPDPEQSPSERGFRRADYDISSRGRY